MTIAGGGDRKGYQQDWRNAREALREIDADIAQGADMVMVKPALAYLDVIQAARAARRRAGRGVPRQRRVRDDQGRRGQRLDRRRRRRARAPHGDQAGRCRRHPHLPRPVVRRRARAARRRRPVDRRRSIPLLRPDACAAAGCDPVVCVGPRRAVQRRAVRALDAGDPRRRQLVDPGLQGGRRPPVRRRPGRGPVRLGRRGHAATSTSSRATARSSSATPTRRSRGRSPRRPRTARRTARRRRAR